MGTHQSKPSEQADQQRSQTGNSGGRRVIQEEDDHLTVEVQEGFLRTTEKRTGHPDVVKEFPFGAKYDMDKMTTDLSDGGLVLTAPRKASTAGIASDSEHQLKGEETTGESVASTRPRRTGAKRPFSAIQKEEESSEDEEEEEESEDEDEDEEEESEDEEEEEESEEESSEEESEEEESSEESEEEATRSAKSKKVNKMQSAYDAAWYVMYEELVEYKDEHGDCIVPRRYEKSPKLGKWVDRQRILYREKRLPKDRKEQLASIGFVWSPGRGRQNLAESVRRSKSKRAVSKRRK